MFPMHFPLAFCWGSSEGVNDQGLHRGAVLSCGSLVNSASCISWWMANSSSKWCFQSVWKIIKMRDPLKYGWKWKIMEKYFKPPQKSSTSHRETDESCTCLSSLSLFCYLKPSGATIIGITPGNDFTILAHSSKGSIGSCYLFDVMKLILISFFRRSPHMTRPYCSCFRNLAITTERMNKKKPMNFMWQTANLNWVQECSINSMFAIDLHFVVLHDIHK